jgi:hypothetical protein
MPPTAPTPGRRRSRAKPKPPRPRAVVVSELRALGGIVLEQALQAPGARPQESMLAWAGRLAAELGCAPAEAPATYRDLMQRIADVNREAQAHPDRPTRALPLAA